MLRSLVETSLALRRNLLLSYSRQKNKLRGKFGVEIKGKWMENVLTRREGEDSFLEDKN
jgi:hypothetical protein